MRLKHFLLFLVVFPFAATCAAQTYEYQTEVFGSVGMSRLMDDDGKLADGANFGGGIGFRPFSRLGFEFEVNGMHYKKRPWYGGLGFVERTPIYFTGNIVYHFSTERHQPYVLAGVGILRYDSTTVWQGVPGGPVEIWEGTDIGPAFSFGVGFKAFLTKKLSLRPEFRLVECWELDVLLAEPPVSLFRASIALGYHW